MILSFKNKALEELFTNHPKAGIELFIASTKELSGKLSEQNKKNMEERNKNVELEI